MTSLTIIVAVDNKNGIGKANALPWRLPEDLAHFKRTTSGHAIIMGRKTFESIGKPLPNRRNIVISRNLQWQHAGVECAASLEAAQALLDDGTAYIIGGAEIYRQAMSLANELIVTKIVQEFACDAFFPEIDLKIWHETAREAHHSEVQNLDYAFVTYKKR
jgi:dihydrofolate reductase